MTASRGYERLTQPSPRETWGVLLHPLAILAVGLCALNDHVLKGWGPGWLTGKTSDFAGLIFFPCLLGVAVRPVLKTHRQAGALAIAATAVVFSLIKCWPMATGVAEEVLRPFRGRTTVRTDPTDLSSLVVLPLTWFIWQRPRRGVHLQRRGLQQIALFAAVLTTAATTPSEPPEFVSAVVVHDGIAYTNELGTRPRSHLESRDGSDWIRIDGGLPENVRAQVTDPPRRATDPLEPNVHYRVVPGRRVEARSTGGPWKLEFEIPDGRHRYMRHRRTPWFSTGIFGGRPNVPPSPGFDAVAALATPKGTVVLVSMGNEGVLRRDQQRRWHREPLADGRPTPLDGGLRGLRWWELLTPLPLMVVYGVVTAAVGSLLLPPRPLEGRRRPFALAGIGAAVLVLVAALAWPPAALAVLLLPASLLVLGSGVARLTLAMMLTPLAAATPWVLWSQGSIASHDTANLFGVAILASGSLLGVASMRQLVRRASRGETSSDSSTPAPPILSH